MIDIKAELQEYKKINLDEIEASGQQLNDETRNSILLYNKAVESLSNGSEDIAIIELKKAVSINPHFYEALNLLGICYGYINEHEKAADIFNRVVRGENNGVKAQKYLGQLKSQEQPSVKTKQAKKSGSTNAVNTAGAVNTVAGGSSVNIAAGTGTAFSRRTAAKSLAQEKKLDIFKYVIGFVAGAILIGAISLLLLHKPEQKVPDSTVDAAASTTQTQQADEYKDKYGELDKNYKQLQKDADKSAKLVEYYKNVIRLYDAESLASGKQLESAADLLVQLKTVEYTGADSEKYNKLKSAILPKAAWIVYEDGVKLFNSKKYAESIKKLEKVALYDPAFSRNDSALYYMGKCYQELNDSRNAIAVYQKLINTYPQSAQAKYAKSKIERLTGQP